MVNQVEYAESRFAIAGCSFLLDVGEEILAATAKHVLTSFESWRMFPKDRPEDVVVIDNLMIHEDPEEPPSHQAVIGCSSRYASLTRLCNPCGYGPLPLKPVKRFT